MFHIKKELFNAEKLVKKTTELVLFIHEKTKLVFLWPKMDFKLLKKIKTYIAIDLE